MPAIFLDTNVVVRAFLQDHPGQSPRAVALLKRIALGEVAVVTTPNLVFEVAFVLQRTYRIRTPEIRARLLDLLGIDGIEVADRQLLRRALDIFAEYNISLVDALHVATMEREGITRIFSFDRHFDRIPGIERVEP